MTDDKLLTAKELRGSGVVRMTKWSYIPLARPNGSALPGAKPRWWLGLVTRMEGTMVSAVDVGGNPRVFDSITAA
jgi:hypothetical protein